VASDHAHSDENPPSHSAPRTHDAGAMEDLVQECVRQVLRILAREKER
jgi:hypothetical protein